MIAGYYDLFKTRVAEGRNLDLERVEELGKSVGGADKALAMFVERQPMGRVGRPEEVAALAVYLASDAAAFTTGTAIPIDGGWTL